MKDYIIEEDIKIFNMFREHFDIIKPVLKINNRKSGEISSYNNIIKRIKIRGNISKEEVIPHLIHEYCHHVQFTFSPKSEVSHNIEFWKLCFIFGLTEKDYPRGLVGKMEVAKQDYNTALKISKDRAGIINILLGEKYGRNK